MHLQGNGVLTQGVIGGASLGKRIYNLGSNHAELIASYLDIPRSQIQGIIYLPDGGRKRPLLSGKSFAEPAVNGGFHGSIRSAAKQHQRDCRDRRSVQAAGPGEIHPGHGLRGRLGRGLRGLSCHARPGGERSRIHPGPRPDPDHQPDRLSVQPGRAAQRAGDRPYPAAPSCRALLRGHYDRAPGGPDLRDPGPGSESPGCALARSSLAALRTSRR